MKKKKAHGESKHYIRTRGKRERGESGRNGSEVDQELGPSILSPGRPGRVGKTKRKAGKIQLKNSIGKRVKGGIQISQGDSGRERGPGEMFRDWKHFKTLNIDVKTNSILEKD